MREIFNDKYYRITIDGEIDELDREDLMKVYMKCVNGETDKEDGEILVYEISFMDDIFDLITHLIGAKNGSL